MSKCLTVCIIYMRRFKNETACYKVWVNKQTPFQIKSLEGTGINKLLVCDRVQKHDL